MKLRTLTRSALLTLSLAMMLGCSTGGSDREQVEEFEYAVPMDSDSPWPKFRRTAMQTGRSPVLPIDTGAPVGLNYTERTDNAPETGMVESVTLDLAGVEDIPASLRVYLMVDAYPSAVDTLTQ